MRKSNSFVLAAAVTSTLAASAWSQTFKMSLGVRETNSGMPIGANGGTAGGIEWINKDNLTFTADGTWQKFEFTFGTDPVSAFTGNGLLDVANGTFEHFRFLNDTGITDPIALYIDDVSQTVGVNTTVIQDFELATPILPTPNGVQHTFRNPRNSGSTNTNIVASDYCNATNELVHGGSVAYRLGFQFVDNAASRWVRFTTFNTANNPNPAIDFVAGSKVSFWAAAVILPSTERWINPGGGNWSEPANWNAGNIPNATSGSLSIANFLGDITGDATVVNDVARNLNTIRFKNASIVTIAGPEAITLRGIAGFNSNITVEQGSHVISAPLTLDVVPLSMNVSSASSVLTITQPIIETSSLAISKTGPGKAVTEAIRTVIDIGAGPVGSTLTVSGGTLQIAADGTDTGTSHIATLSTSGTGVLDLTDNDLIATSSTIGTIVAKIVTGRNGGNWDGVGVTSSAAAASGGLTTLGAMTGQEYTDITTSTTFDSIGINATDILVKYTWYGDTDFNGVVDFDDYVRIDGGFNATLTGWVNGDFDFNDIVDFDDYVLIDSGFNGQNGTLIDALNWLEGEDRSLENASLPGVAKVIEHYNEFGMEYVNAFYANVPEPTSVGLVGLAVAGLARRRRR